jgi:hypothetical protein
MPREPRRPSVLGLIYILTLTFVTGGFFVFMVFSFVRGAADDAGIPGLFGASFALLAALWARGKSRGLVRVNLGMFAACLVAVAVSEWMS